MESMSEPSHDENLMCRICWENQIKDEDPIVILGCNCQKPLDQAHTTCLFKWFTRSMLDYNPTHDNQAFYKTCEICKANLSSSILLFIQSKLNSGLIRDLEHEEVMIEVLQQNEIDVQMTPSSNENNCTWKMIFFILVLLSSFMLLISF
jgi:hypothetical protein